MEREILVYTAGNIHNDLYVDIGIWTCGNIVDGVSLQHGRKSGGYVLAFSDLETIYKAAKKFREEKQ